jgi:hypothetical protein
MIDPHIDKELSEDIFAIGIRIHFEEIMVLIGKIEVCFRCAQTKKLAWRNWTPQAN